MHFVKFLGLMDALVVALVILYAAELVPGNLLVLGILFLGGKAFFFRGDIASILDGGVAIILLLLLWGFQNMIILSICLLYLLQKAIRSLA